jgi:hypothetical protein
METGRRMPYLADKPLGEDAYYMMTVGWELGHGGGLAYHGQATTGIQPLMTIVYGALAAIAEAFGGTRWTFARAALLLGVGGLLAFAWLVATLAREIAPPQHGEAAAAAAVVLTAANYSLFRIFTYGLETGLYILLVGLCVRASLARPRQPDVAWAVRFGLVAGAAALARIDFFVLMGVFLFASLVRREISLSRCIVVGMTMAVVASPWVLWVHAASGNWSPSSAQAQRGITTAAGLPHRVSDMFFAAAQHAAPWVYLEIPRTFARAVTANWEEAVAALAVLLLLVPAVLFVRAGSRTLVPSTRTTLATWGIAVAALLAVYVVLFWPTFFYLRYAAPLFVVVAPVLAAGAAATLTPRWMAGGCAAVVLLFAATAAVTLHTGRLGNRHSLTAGFVANDLPHTAGVGAYQSGVVGYFNDNVTNLDGKVNSQALKASQEHRLEAYLDGQQIWFLIDWPEVLANSLPSAYLQANWKACARQMPSGQSLCLERR